MTPNPRGVVVSPDGRFVYVAIGFNDDVEVVDTQSNTVVDTIQDAGNDPFCITITPDGKFAYASGDDADLVYVINTATDTIVDTIPISNPSSYGTFFATIERTPIPTMSEWGLIAMAGVLGIVGFMVMRRRKAAA